MSAPTPYDRQNSFALFSAENPSEPHSGTTLDIEFNAVKVSLDETQSNLALIQDDDGQLARGSVGRDQLDSSITIGFASPTPWATGSNYSAGVSTVFQEAIFYSCLVDHVSGDFAADLTAGKWLLVADLSAAAALPDGGVTEAKLADGAVTANKLVTNSVTTSKIASSAVSTPKIQNSAVTADKLGADAVTTEKILDANVTTAKIADLNVTTAKIADDAVTLAKLVGASAQYKILARKSASSGDFEECSLSELLDFVTGAAQGDILYRGASAWARLAAGTSGQFLKTLGAAANPAWATPIFAQEYTSADTNVTYGGTGSFSHGLGVIPKLIQMFLVCQTTEAGYAPGDVVAYSYPESSFTLTSSAIAYAHTNGAFDLPNKSTGVFTNLTAANWKFRLKAFA